MQRGRTSRDLYELRDELTSPYSSCFLSGYLSSTKRVGHASRCVISVYGSGPRHHHMAFHLRTPENSLKHWPKNGNSFHEWCCAHILRTRARIILRFQVSISVTCHSVDSFSELRVLSALASTNQGTGIPHVYIDNPTPLPSSQIYRWAFIYVTTEIISRCPNPTKAANHFVFRSPRIAGQRDHCSLVAVSLAYMYLLVVASPHEHGSTKLFKILNGSLGLRPCFSRIM